MRTGDKIKLYRIARRETDRCGKMNQAKIISQIWTVAGIYPHFALLVNRYGIRECFSYWYLRRHAHVPRKTERNGVIVWEWGDCSAEQQNT